MFVAYLLLVDFSRGHTLDMRKIIFPQEMIDLDVLGYYKPLALAGNPTETYFYEDYPIGSEAFIFKDVMADPHYEFEDPAEDFKKSLTPSKNPKRPSKEEARQ
eukprot:TRINITY_DN2523_c0_g2_i1.p1 TRINITY_DN2523_c0_g2~~TRINITY_DN2523_c0_g2_i1.p1  ORF type:complete len:103 (-),score=19.78 TRINITY_DN2523_c0_g2_i1:134-442(-)